MPKQSFKKKRIFTENISYFCGPQCSRIQFLTLSNAPSFSKLQPVFIPLHLVLFSCDFRHFRLKAWRSSWTLSPECLIAAESKPKILEQPWWVGNVCQTPISFSPIFLSLAFKEKSQHSSQVLRGIQKTGSSQGPQMLGAWRSEELVAWEVGAER